MKLVHKVLLPATLLITFSINSAAYSMKAVKVSPSNQIVNPVRILRDIAAVSDENKKDKVNKARKKAKENMKNTLAKRVSEGEITQEEADECMKAFAVNAKRNCMREAVEPVRVLSKEDVLFRKEFKRALWSQAESGKITRERAEDIYNCFVDMTV